MLNQNENFICFNEQFRQSNTFSEFLIKEKSLKDVFSPAGIDKIDLLRVKNELDLSPSEICARMLNAPMCSRDLFRKHIYLPRRGY